MRPVDRPTRKPRPRPLLEPRRTCKFGSAAPAGNSGRRRKALFMENLTTIFIGVTAVAVLLQAGQPLRICLSLPKTRPRPQGLAPEAKTQALPHHYSAPPSSTTHPP